MNFKKHFLLFVVFGIFVLVLVPQEIKSAVIVGPGCARGSTVEYKTECEEEKGKIGSCRRECCREHEECETTCDEEDNCTETCWDVCDERCWECSCSGSWDEYSSACNKSSSCSCNTDEECCDKDILWRYCSVHQEGDCHMGSCENERCCVECDASDTCEECGSWQKPVRAGCEGDCTKWGSTKPKCKCCGECIEAPKNARYYQSPDSSIPADSPVKLPVKLDWDDVPGWWGGWSGGGSNVQDYAECQREYIDPCWDEVMDAVEEYKKTHPDYRFCPGEWTDEYLVCLRRETKDHCEEELQDEECEKTCPLLEGADECYNPDEFVNYYQIEISGELRNCETLEDINGYTAFLEASEFFAPCFCFFKSNRTYNWKVRACCDDNESTCGPWSEKQIFKTSLAPEPIWPYDPDWAGPGRAEPIWQTPTVESPRPVHLEWCPVDEAKSYCLRMYKAGTPFIRMYGQGEPFCPVLFSELFCPAIVPPEKDFPIQSYFDFGLDVFTKETDYQWKVATCLNQEGQKCGLNCPEDKICYTFETLKSECGCCDFSQLWNFFGQVVLPVPELISPKDGEFVNFTHELKWTHVPGAHSYRYEIKIGPNVIVNEAIRSEYLPIRDLWNSGILTFNTTYTWRIQPCWDENGRDCQDESWSEEWGFTTTGATPTGLDPPNEAVGVVIPIKLNWDDMGGAASYNYEAALDSGFGNIIADGLLTGSWPPPVSEVSINYDSGIQHPKQNTVYYWRINTCADIEGNICGNWAVIKSFTTFELSAPEKLHPPKGGEFYTYETLLKWELVLGGAFYRYELDGESTIVPSNYAFISTATLDLGEHTWNVQACLDENCEEFGPFGDDWTFDLVEGEAPSKGGIVPCGRYTDNPNTPWNERKACGVEHIFIMIFLIIEFLLWKVIPIVLALLALASGVIFYFSGQLGITDPLIQVKSLWKAAGLGLVVVFLAWTGISLLLGLFGYQVGLFGPWWRIEF